MSDTPAPSRFNSTSIKRGACYLAFVSAIYPLVVLVEHPNNLLCRFIVAFFLALLDSVLVVSFLERRKSAVLQNSGFRLGLLFVCLAIAAFSTVVSYVLAALGVAFFICLFCPRTWQNK